MWPSSHTVEIYNYYHIIISYSLYIISLKTIKSGIFD